MYDKILASEKSQVEVAAMARIMRQAGMSDEDVKHVIGAVLLKQSDQRSNERNDGKSDWQIWSSR